MCVCVVEGWVCRGVQVLTGPEVSDPLELVVVSHPVWVLGIDAGSLEEQYMFFITEPFLQHPRSHPHCPTTQLSYPTHFCDENLSELLPRCPGEGSQLRPGFRVPLRGLLLSFFIESVVTAIVC